MAKFATAGHSSQELELTRFQERFQFDPSKLLYVGVERESFTVNSEGKIVPAALGLTHLLGNGRKLGYEFSACQIEERVGPCPMSLLPHLLYESSNDLRELLQQYRVVPSYLPVAPIDIPMDYYPDPNGRYKKLVEIVDEERLRSAFRVAAVHVHVGMASHVQALSVYNEVIGHLDDLCRMGDRSGGERLDIYRVMAQHVEPPRYHDWATYFRYASEHGFVSDPRQCWTLIRISQHGTIEFRMFDTTGDDDLIVQWAQKCVTLCERYL